MGLAGLAALGLDAPMTDKAALVIVETDGCFADGIQVASGATIGHRTLRVADLGKVAATFVEIKTGRAVRLVPAVNVRQCALSYAPEEKRLYFAQLEGYQVMPEAELFTCQEVALQPPLETILSRPEARAICARCGEEIINQREVTLEGIVLCQTCYGGSYYSPRA